MATSKAKHNYAKNRYTGKVPAHRITPEGYKRGDELQFDETRLTTADMKTFYPDFKLGTFYVLVSVFIPKVNHKAFCEVTLRTDAGDCYGYVASHHLKRYGKAGQGAMKHDPVLAPNAKPESDGYKLTHPPQTAAKKVSPKISEAGAAFLKGKSSAVKKASTNALPAKGDHVSLVGTCVHKQKLATAKGKIQAAGFVASVGKMWLTLKGSSRQYAVDSILTGDLKVVKVATPLLKAAAPAPKAVAVSANAAIRARSEMPKSPGLSAGVPAAFLKGKSDKQVEVAGAFVPKKGDHIRVIGSGTTQTSSGKVDRYEAVDTKGVVASCGKLWLILAGSSKQYAVTDFTFTQM